MKLRSVQPKTFTQLFEVLKEHKPDILVHFHTDSIKIFASDVGKTSIAYVTLWGNCLEQYECDRHQPVGVNIPKLWTVLKVASADDILVMEFDEKKEDALNISIIDGKSKASKLSTGYITYNCEDEILALPDNVNSNSCISMNSHNFYSNLKTLEGMECEYVTLKQCTSPNGGYRLSLIGVGSQFHKNPCINIDEDSAAKSQMSLEEILLCFPLKKLVQFAKAYVLDEKVSIHLNRKGLLILQYKVKIYGELQFLIMSTNDDDDEEDGVDSDQEEDDDAEGEDDAANKVDKKEQTNKRPAMDDVKEPATLVTTTTTKTTPVPTVPSASSAPSASRATVEGVAVEGAAVPKKKAAPPALKKVKL